MVISASLQACGVVFPFAMLTSICRSIVTICSGLYLLIGMPSFSSKWILSHSTWYKFRRSRQYLQHPLFLDALQAPLQKIDLQSLLTDLPFQLGNPALAPARLPVAGKRIAGPLPKLTPPTVQYIGVDFQRPRRLGQRYPCFQPPYRGQLELLGELPAR